MLNRLIIYLLINIYIYVYIKKCIFNIHIMLMKECNFTNLNSNLNLILLNDVSIIENFNE